MYLLHHHLELLLQFTNIQGKLHLFKNLIVLITVDYYVHLTKMVLEIRKSMLGRDLVVGT